MEDTKKTNDTDNSKDKNAKRGANTESGASTKKIFFIVGIALIASLAYFFGKGWFGSGNLSNTLITQKIVILKTVDHPALDVNQQGAIDELKKCCPNIAVSSQSANADPNLAVQISRKISDEKPDAVITIGTMASQAAALNVTNTIPIIFSSVTDPLSAGLVQTLEVPGQNVTGVSNRVDSVAQFKVFKSIYPTLKTIGVIYNPGESNSVSLLESMINAAKKIDLVIKVAPANNTGEVQAAAKNIIDNVDIIFINNDNTALSALPSIIKVADDAKKPVFSSDIENIGQGVLAAVGPEQSKLGAQAAKMAVQAINNHGKVSDMPVEFPKVMSVVMDPDKAKLFGDKIVLKSNFEIALVDTNGDIIADSEASDSTDSTDRDNKGNPKSSMNAKTTDQNSGNSVDDNSTDKAANVVINGDKNQSASQKSASQTVDQKSFDVTNNNDKADDNKANSATNNPLQDANKSSVGTDNIKSVGQNGGTTGTAGAAGNTTTTTNTQNQDQDQDVNGTAASGGGTVNGSSMTNNSSMTNSSGTNSSPANSSGTNNADTTTNATKSSVSTASVAGIANAASVDNSVVATGSGSTNGNDNNATTNAVTNSSNKTAMNQNPQVSQQNTTQQTPDNAQAPSQNDNAANTNAIPPLPIIPADSTAGGTDGSSHASTSSVGGGTANSVNSANVNGSTANSVGKSVSNGAGDNTDADNTQSNNNAR